MGEDDSRRMRMDSVSHQGDQGRQGKEPMVNQVCYSCASRSAPLIYMGFFLKIANKFTYSSLPNKRSAIFISHAQLLFIFKIFECATFIRLCYICFTA